MMKCTSETNLPEYLVSDIPQRSEQLAFVLNNLVAASVLPVANVDFLINEMTNRYENTDSVEARFFNGKIEKDIVRYTTLKKFSDNVLLNTTPNVMDPFLWWSMKLTRISEGLKYFGCIYSSQFDFIRTYKKGTKLEVVAPDRFRLDNESHVNQKSKTGFSSKG